MGGIGYSKLQVLEMSEENGFTWTVKGELPWAKPCVERMSAASAVVNDKLWLMGGLVTEDDDDEEEENEYEPTASVSIYDPSLDSWAAGPPLPAGAVGGTSGYGCDTAVHDGEIHLNFRRGSSIVYRGGAWEELPEGAPVIHGA